MEMSVSATELARDCGFYLRRARTRVVAVTYHGEVAGYLVSPDVYARILQGAVIKQNEHQAANARMDEMWARRTGVDAGSSPA